MTESAGGARQKQAVCEEFIRISVLQQVGTMQVAEIVATSHGYRRGSEVAEQFFTVDGAEGSPDGQFDCIAD